MAPCAATCISCGHLLFTDGDCFSTRAWSITKNADGTHEFHPAPFGPDHIRENLQPSALWYYEIVTVANHDGDLAANNGRRHEDHHQQGRRETSRDPYEDEYEDEDWDWDWGYPAPSPNLYGRASTYASDYDFSDGEEDDFEPQPYGNHRRNPYANIYDFSDEDEDGFEPFPRGNRRRNMSAYDYDLSDDYEAELAPFPYRGRRRNTRLSEYNGRERDTDYLEPFGNRGVPRGASTRDIHRRGRDRGAPESPQYRGHSYGSRRHGAGLPEPVGPFSSSRNRHGRNRRRDRHMPVGAVDIPRRRQRARPQPRLMCRMLRSFLNFTLGGT